MYVEYSPHTVILHSFQVKLIPEGLDLPKMMADSHDNDDISFCSHRSGHCKK